MASSAELRFTPRERRLSPEQRVLHQRLEGNRHFADMLKLLLEEAGCRREHTIPLMMQATGIRSRCDPELFAFDPRLRPTRHRKAVFGPADSLEYGGISGVWRLSAGESVNKILKKWRPQLKSILQRGRYGRAASKPRDRQILARDLYVYRFRTLTIGQIEEGLAEIGLPPMTKSSERGNAKKKRQKIVAGVRALLRRTEIWE